MDSKKLDKLIKLLKLANHNPNDSEANLAARAAARMLGDENYRWVEDAKKNGGTPPKPSSPNLNFTPVVKDWYNLQDDTYNIKITNVSRMANPEIDRILRQLAAAITYKPKTWNDVHRSEEPFWANRPPPYRDPPKTNYQPFVDVDFGDDIGREEFYGQAKRGGDWKDFFDKETKRQQDKRDQQRAAKVEYEQKQQEARERARRAREGFGTRYTWNRDEVNWDNPRSRRTVYEKHCRDCSVCGMTQLTTDESNPFICYQCKIKF